ncbi:mannose-1-phosphate guanylyltransferase [Porphyromonadaceae bacterium OttesenSCG-928-L07]|nr:mannose-1-phosphate guanylyltransferase [Porphyromonadaceae bacterium OttesenSCG-928-L07]MDL2251623.1 mannose-1-phosphate guanylyltransferase [Odoribacter sp. OttesenSCG-928-J03]
MKQENIYCLILAGGIGNRLWPISNQKCPKQFTDILNTGKSLIRQSFERIRQIIPDEYIYVITGTEYASITQEQLPEIPAQNIIKEPFRRNTATSIMYAAAKIRKMAEDATMVIIPSDHFITNDLSYLQNIEKGVDYINECRGLLTIGIEPTRIETQYGYIQVKDEKRSQVYAVKTFTEKPDRELAQKFFESGDFLWNAGIFIWKVEDIIEEIKRHIYDLYVFFEDDSLLNTDQEEEFIRNTYGECPSSSIDFAVLERSSNVFVLKGDFGWSDVSTWHTYQALNWKDASENTANTAGVVFQDARDCVVNVPEDKKVVVCGVDNLIIAEKDGYLMVCNKDYEEQVKLFENKFKR